VQGGSELLTVADRQKNAELLAGSVGARGGLQLCASSLWARDYSANKYLYIVRYIFHCDPLVAQCLNQRLMGMRSYGTVAGLEPLNNAGAQPGFLRQFELREPGERASRSQ
jgi:hypothetical protein